MSRRCVPQSLPSASSSWGRGADGRLRLLLGLLTLGLGLGLGAPRMAAARRENNRATLLQQAQPLIAKGVAALAAKDFATATKSLSSAYRSAPVPEVLLQLARLAQAEGRAVDAYDLYRRYLADPTRIPDDAAARETDAVLAAPPPESGSLAIIGPPSALVLIDDRIVGVLPLPQPLLLAAGKHSLVLDLGGKRLDTPLQVLAGRLSEVRTGKSSGALLISLLPALIVLDEWPGVATETLRPFTEAIERAVIGKQMGVMPAAVALRQGFELKQCLSTLTCQQQLAKRCSLDYLLRSRVVREVTPAPSATASWTIELTLVHAEVSDPASTATVTCPACTGEQAAARYRDALTDVLTRGLPRQFGTAQVTSEPSEAAVALAERPLGKTPLHLTLWEGSYELKLTLPGYQPAPQTLTITAGKETPLSVPMLTDAPPVAVVPPPLPPPPRSTARLPRPLWRWKLGGALWGAGGALITTGFGLEPFNRSLDHCFPGDQAVSGAPCRFEYDTSAATGITLIAGFAFSIAGTIIMAMPGPRPN